MTTCFRYNLTREENFSQKISGDIADLWETRNEGNVTGSAGKSLYWVSLTSEKHTKAIVVVNGRVESVWKYQELFYDLFQNGYDVYAFDHRGQGLSERTIDDEHIGHVHSFSDYVDDMAIMVDAFDLGKYQKRFLLAHSMGGAVITRYLQTKPVRAFQAFAASAPMYGVNMAWHLKPFGLFFTRVLAMTHKEPDYATKNKHYFPKPFENNPLSQCEVRYRWFRQLYETMPQLKLGGPSAHWAWQSLTAAKQCIKDARRLEVPYLLLQASDDSIVSNDAQNRFFAKHKAVSSKSRMEIIPGAKHEIFFEKDEYRQPALSKILGFFDKF
ncbi:alpha/beta fold hydrolase [Vibrio sp. JC009]|uniref:alpha/beta fold hydrolase n=1 Tax=Vibrio sp. JC009 TaxID=2912314 RepID=UPI0023B1E0DE|nr:alpha/beta fold hydrolase [Vibrio sp. JC009]WED21762.1 alpha/beta fold hydrolase [Vibrio sp. JC009]